MTDLHILSSAKAAGALHRPEQYAATPVPSLADWNYMWQSWDTVTLGMIPKKELLAKPINLRNAIIFYLGHIPTFLDIHLTRASGSEPTPPEAFRRIFERGIDPDVDDPEKCHSHSEIPESWPSLEEILEFQDRVRDRVNGFYERGIAQSNYNVGRALWLTFEHEVMHLETLLYMLLQSNEILPPERVKTPNFQCLAEEARRDAVPRKWYTVPAVTITVGLDDVEDQPEPARFFGWDNEKPARQAHVHAFSASSRPLTNGEYFDYYINSDCALPASWKIDDSAKGPSDLNQVSTQTNGHTNHAVNGNTNGHINGTTSHSTNGVHTNPEHDHILKKISVRTVFGSIPLAYALSWPAIASYDELAGCAAYMGGRIPTVEEVRSLYHYAENQKAAQADKVLSRRISAVNGHLSNEGVEETPPSTFLHGCNGAAVAISTNGSGGGVKQQLHQQVKGEKPDPKDTFVDIEDCNVGFRKWHPTSVTGDGGRLRGRADFGGVWEWTSSVLEKHAGFEPMTAYPAYTSDFFDGKHNIVLGGSWATHPRVAGRKSFVNWYQRNYPYVWAGARIVKDL